MYWWILLNRSVNNTKVNNGLYLVENIKNIKSGELRKIKKFTRLKMQHRQTNSSKIKN